MIKKKAPSVAKLVILTNGERATFIRGQLDSIPIFSSPWTPHPKSWRSAICTSTGSHESALSPSDPIDGPLRQDFHGCFCFVLFRFAGPVLCPPAARVCRRRRRGIKLFSLAVRKISVVNRTTKTCRSTTRAEEKSVYLKSSAVGFFFSCAWHVQCMYMVFV